MLSITDLIKSLWARLGSMSLAIILLVVLAIASVIGTVLLQNQDQGAYLQQFGPLWYWVFRSLGLFDMYHTWWFLSILGFLMVSLSACLWRNVPRMLKEMRSRKVSLADKSLKHFQFQQEWKMDVDQSPDALGEAFRHRLQGWEFKQSTEGGRTTIRADKGRWNKWGYILVHSAILVILIGGWIGVHYGFRGDMAVPEGQTENEISFLKGTDTQYLKMPFEVRCNTFFIDFYPTGAPKEFRSNLTIIDKGKEVLTSDIIVNEPLYYKGVRIYQASFGDGGSGITFKLFHMDGSQQIDTVKTNVYKSWTDKKTGVSIKVTDFKPYNVENMANPGEPNKWRDLGPAVEFEMRGPGLKPVKIKMFQNPFVDSEGVNHGSFMSISLTGDKADYKPVALGIDLNNPDEWKLFHAFMKRLNANTSGVQRQQANLEAFKGAMRDVFGDKRPEKFQEMAMRTLQAVSMLPKLPWPLLPALDDYDLHYYTGLQLARDPGMNVVWVGSALLVLGLCIMLYMPHRKLWLIIRQHEDGKKLHVSLAGMANRNQLSFEQSFNDLFTQLTQDFSGNKTKGSAS
ncbi:MAG TPA: cytochrome c biogenesis protein ResB [Mariprofundaceae bacterium]|nr:cytochrome c biogenesis protein ResB [Mariprofundaceae bacterium]